VTSKGNIGRTAILVVIAIACGIVSGLLMVVAMTPAGWWPLIFVGLVPMVFAQYRLLPRVWCWIPVSVTALVYVGGGYSYQFVDSARPYFFLAPIVVAIIFAPLAVMDRALSERSSFKLFVLQMPVMWTGLDALRQNLSLSGTTGDIVYSLTREARLIEPVSVFGIFGLELLILAINYGLALLVLHAVSWDKLGGLVPLRKVVAWSVSVVVVAAVAWGVSGAALYNSVQASSGTTIRVAAVQPGSAYANDNADTLPTAVQEAGFEAQLSLMTERAARLGAKLVVWPEEYLPFNPATGPAADRAWLTGLVEKTHVYVVTGFVGPLSSQAEDWVPYSYRNQAALIGPNGTVLGIYTKQHQAPFDDDLFATGSASPSYPTSIGTIGVEICYDFAFQGPTRVEALGGANILAIPSWQGSSDVNIPNWDRLVFDAVENRVPAVNADQAWMSIIVKANGQIVSFVDDPSSSGRTALLVGDVQLGPRNSPFLTLGNWIGDLAIFGTVGLVAFGLIAIFSDRRKARPRATRYASNEASSAT
jgi:apolipoprotein N-acyltransferase